MNNLVQVMKLKPMFLPINFTRSKKHISKKCPINGQYLISK